MMSETDEVAAILDVYSVDLQTEAERRIGALELSAAGMLAVLEVEPPHALKLSGAVASVNAKPRLVELVPPSGATEPGQTGALVAERGTPDFVPALDRYFRKYYGFALG
jgi:hypothetical protein